MPFVTGTCVAGVRSEPAGIGRSRHVGRALFVSFSFGRKPRRVRRERPVPGLSARSLVDGVERVLAARQPAAHPVQHALDPAARSGRWRPVRRRANGHHLHDRRRGRLPPQLSGRRVHGVVAHSGISGRSVDGRGIGVHLRPAWRPRLLRAPNRVLNGRQSGLELCHSAFYFWIHLSGRRQLCARRRVRRWLLSRRSGSTR